VSFVAQVVPVTHPFTSFPFGRRKMPSWSAGALFASWYEQRTPSEALRAPHVDPQSPLVCVPFKTVWDVGV